MLEGRLKVNAGILGNGGSMTSRERPTMTKFGATLLAGMILGVSRAMVRVGRAHGAGHDGWSDTTRSVRVGVVEQTRVRDRRTSVE